MTKSKTIRWLASSSDSPQQGSSSYIVEKGVYRLVNYYCICSLLVHVLGHVLGHVLAVLYSSKAVWFAEEVLYFV